MSEVISITAWHCAAVKVKRKVGKLAVAILTWIRLKTSSIGRCLVWADDTTMHYVAIRCPC